MTVTETTSQPTPELPGDAGVAAPAAASDPASEPTSACAAKPLRADAQRNRDKVLAAAREAFNENGASTSLEAIARRAGVGIGTLYRHFPTRQALLEAVYVDEVEQLATAAHEYAALPPWDALAAWLRRLGAYLVTKHALAAELLNYVDRDAQVFSNCRRDLYEAGAPLLDAAMAAGEVRPDAQLQDVVQMIGGIAKIQTADPEMIGRIIGMALDGLRPRR